MLKLNENDYFNQLSLSNVSFKDSILKPIDSKSYHFRNNSQSSLKSLKSLKQKNSFWITSWGITKNNESIREEESIYLQKRQKKNEGKKILPISVLTESYKQHESSGLCWGRMLPNLKKDKVKLTKTLETAKKIMQGLPMSDKEMINYLEDTVLNLKDVVKEKQERDLRKIEWIWKDFD